MSSAPAQYLFVYGTLMRGGRLHTYLGSSNTVTFVGEAKILAELYRLLDEDYPGAVQSSKPDSFVHGELYEMHRAADTLKELDEVEGCEEGLFFRRMVEATIDSRTLPAWVYFYARPLLGAKLVPDGRYRIRNLDFQG